MLCEFCKLKVHTRRHHLIPRSEKGKAVANTCRQCEEFIHNRWTNHELRDIYNNVEIILKDDDFQYFLKWRVKQPPETLYRVNMSNKRTSKRKYS